MNPSRTHLPTATLLAWLAVALFACGGAASGGGKGIGGDDVQGSAGFGGGGGSSSAGEGGHPTKTCSQQDCAGLGAPADAQLCPDGTNLGRTLCTREPNGACYWDFPECPAAPDAASPTNPNNACPLVLPHDPGKATAICPLLGQWALSSSHGAVQSTGIIEFDPGGAYYGGPVGAVLSQSYTYDGAFEYQASPPDAGGIFKAGLHLLSSCGDGCSGQGWFTLEFQNGCSTAILVETTTECSGSRIAFAGTVLLTR